MQETRQAPYPVSATTAEPKVAESHETKQPEATLKSELAMEIRADAENAVGDEVPPEAAPCPPPRRTRSAMPVVDEAEDDRANTDRDDQSSESSTEGAATANAKVALESNVAAPKDIHQQKVQESPPPAANPVKIHPMLRWLAKATCSTGCLMEDDSYFAVPPVMLK